MQSVGLHPDEDKEAEHDDEQQQEDMPLSPARNKELGQQDAGDDHRGAEVSLEDDEQRHESQQREKGHDAVFERADPFAVALQPERHEDDAGDFGQLRRLHLHRPQPQPAAGAVDLDPKVRQQHEHEQENRHPRQRPGERSQAVIVDVGAGPEQDDAERQPEQLPLEVKRRVMEPQPALYLGGGEDHDQPEGGQRQDGEHERPVAATPEPGGRQRPARGRQLERGARPHRLNSASTVALKRRPRSS